MIKAITAVASLLLGTAILLTGQGLQGVLMPVRASLEEFSTLAIGFIGTTYFLGFTIGSWKGPGLIRRAGHVRVFAAMTALASASPLLLGLWVNLWSWAILRLTTGFCFAVLYIVIESWLNERSNNSNRGRIFSAYTLINMTVLAVGQQMMLLDDPLQLNLFAVTSVLVSLAAVPVLMSRSESPRRIEDARLDLRQVFRTSPVGMLGSLASGLANGSFWALAPVFAVAVSGEVSAAAWFMTAGVLGGATGQYPLGWISDSVDRRHVLIVIALLAALAGIIIWAVTVHMPIAALVVSGFVWGSMAFPVYSIAAAHANDRAAPGSYVVVSSGLLLMYGIGAICGPLIASIAMTVAGTGALYLYTAFIHGGLALFVWYRGGQREKVSPELQGEFSDALTSVITATIVHDEGSQAAAENGEPEDLER